MISINKDNALWTATSLSQNSFAYALACCLNIRIPFSDRLRIDV